MLATLTAFLLSAAALSAQGLIVTNRMAPTTMRGTIVEVTCFRQQGAATVSTPEQMGCAKKRVADYPNLSNYMRELYRVPGVPETVRPRYYVIGYYSIKKVNPTGIIPKGTPIDLSAPHDRGRLAA